MNAFLRVRLFRAMLLGSILALGPAQANQIIRETAGTVNLEVSKGVLIRLDRPAHTIFVADPKVADIQVKSPRLVYVLGKRPGEPP